MHPKCIFADIKVDDPGDQWRNDLQSRNISNPHYKYNTLEVEERDKKMMAKKHHAQRLKYIALDQEAKVRGKKILKEWKKNLF